MTLFRNWPLLLVFLPLLTAGGETQSIWQIGKFDESPSEFLRGAEDSATFVVGKSDPGKDWPGRQLTGHPYRIVFTLGAIQGAYTLTIATLIEQPRVPVFTSTSTVTLGHSFCIRSSAIRGATSRTRSIRTNRRAH